MDCTIPGESCERIGEHLTLTTAEYVPLGLAHGKVMFQETVCSNGAQRICSGKDETDSWDMRKTCF